jgi:uncharacterized protein GlcG (DUF336 family)
MITVKTLSLDDAKTIIEAGKAHAKKIGVPSTLCVVDISGTVIAQERMDGASLSSVELANNKAYTASSLRMSTSAIGAIAKPGDPFFGIANGLGGRAIVFAGGLPIQVDGQVVGALGSSGGTGEQDEEVAKTAVSSFSGAIL